MSERQASIKATLKTNSFVSSLSQLVGASKTTGDKIGKALGGPIHSGLEKAHEGLRETMHGFKEATRLAAEIGGGISIAEFVKESVDLEHTFRDIAFNANKIPGNMVTWKQVQKDVDEAALKTGANSKELAGAYDQIFSATGNLKFTRESLEAIGTAAETGQGTVTELANAAQLLERKFGIGAEEIGPALTAMVEKSKVGGVGLDEMGNKFALMAGEAVQAGFKGKEGISQMLGAMIMLDARIGEKASPALKGMLQKLKDGTSAMKEFRKQTGVKLDGVSGFEKIGKMLTGRARARAELMFTGDMRTVFDELVKPFDETVAAAKKAGKSQKEAQKEGKAAFDKSMAAMSASTMQYSDLQKEAAKRMEEDPSAILKHAIEVASQAFRDPEMLEAIHSLAKDLPPLAHGFAKLVGWVVQHPWLAGGAALGARPAMGFVGGMASKGASMIAEAAWKRASKSIGEAIAENAATSGSWGKAGGVIGSVGAVAIGAAIAYELGKAAINKSIKEHFGNVNSLQDAVNAGGVAEQGTADQKRQAIDMLKQQIAKAQANSPSYMSIALGKGAAALTGDKKMDAMAMHAEATRKAAAEIAVLEASLSKTTAPIEEAGFATSRMNIAADAAARTLNKIARIGGTGADGGKGVAGGGSPRPGAAPVPG